MVWCESSDWFCSDRGVGEFNRTINDRLKYLVTKGFDQTTNDLFGVQCTTVDHGGKYTVNNEVGINAILKFFDCFYQQCDSAESNKLCGQGANLTDSLGGLIIIS